MTLHPLYLLFILFICPPLPQYLEFPQPLLFSLLCCTSECRISFFLPSRSLFFSHSLFHHYTFPSTSTRLYSSHIIFHFPTPRSLPREKPLSSFILLPTILFLFKPNFVLFSLFTSLFICFYQFKKSALFILPSWFRILNHLY